MKYYTNKEAAEYLRFSPYYLANMRMRGRGPTFHKVGAKVLYSQMALDMWVERGNRQPAKRRSMARV